MKIPLAIIITATTVIRKPRNYRNVKGSLIFHYIFHNIIFKNLHRVWHNMYIMRATLVPLARNRKKILNLPNIVRIFMRHSIRITRTNLFRYFRIDISFSKKGQSYFLAILVLSKFIIIQSSKTIYAYFLLE